MHLKKRIRSLVCMILISSSLVVPAVAAAAAAPVQQVWLSATGEKYHNVSDCGRMNPAKARQVTLEEAVNAGYEACKKCYNQ